VRQIGEKLYGNRQREAAVDNWTVALVERRLDDAAQVMRRLPPFACPATSNTWPSMMVEFADCVGRETRPMRLPPPSTAAITRMEEALGWLRWLESADAKLVWARSDRTPWKAICWRFGIGRATAHRLGNTGSA